MNRALRIGLFIGLIVADVIGGARPPAEAVDARPLGETATRLPRGRIATSVEGGHSCMVVADSTVRCWGLNAFGQLGDGTTLTPAASVRVTGISSAIGVTTGRDHSCALLADATVRCWGANAVGQLGNGSTTSSFAPVTVSGITNAVSISGGSNHTCVRRSDGTIACWGSNEFGQLGDNSLGNNRPAPVPVQGISNARMVAVGSTHTCAARADGTVACWGGNGVGQLGIGVIGGNRAVPNTVAGLTGVWLVASGHRFSCALLGTSEVRCWGLNDTGQLGDGTTTNSSTPVIAQVGFSKTSLTLGNGHACVLLTKTILCWGQNVAGELGRGVAGAPQLAPGIAGGILLQTMDVVTGLDRTCALSPRDLVRCWGENSLGQLGNGSTADVLAPTEVGGVSGAVSARGAAAGVGHTCAWRADGTVACWGRNFEGALGDGTFVERHAPVPVTDLLDTIAVVAGDRHNCATTTAGLFADQSTAGISCWGENFEGQVSPFETDDFITTPASPFQATSVNLAAGGRHSMNIRLSVPESTTLGWGRNEEFQLGDVALAGGGNRFSASPLAEPVALVAGVSHTCALQARGTIRCWGSNLFGQLGIGSNSTGAIGIPQPVVDIVDAVAIAAGQFHTCAVLVAGTVRCWGRNDSRQLGDGTTQDRRSPVTVPGIGVGAAVGVVAGRTYTCILTVRGNVQCWGANSRGELGDGTFVDRPSPVFVRRQLLSGTLALSGVVALVGGNTHACVVGINGQPACWGNNENGQLGDTTTFNRVAAVGVPSFTANIAPEGDVSPNGRRAELTALVNCAEGARFRVRLTLQQEGAEGHGHAEGACDGGLARVAVHVSAQGRARFDEGAAEASAVIDVRLKGELIDHQEWGRVVDLR